MLIGKRLITAFQNKNVSLLAVTVAKILALEDFKTLNDHTKLNKGFRGVNFANF